MAGLEAPMAALNAAAPPTLAGVEGDLTWFWASAPYERAAVFEWFPVEVCAFFNLHEGITPTRWEPGLTLSYQWTVEGGLGQAGGVGPDPWSPFVDTNSPGQTLVCLEPCATAAERVRWMVTVTATGKYYTAGENGETAHIVNETYEIPFEVLCYRPIIEVRRMGSKEKPGQYARIAAGGVDTPEHKAVVVLRTTPADEEHPMGVATISTWRPYPGSNVMGPGVARPPTLDGGVFTSGDLLNAQTCLYAVSEQGNDLYWGDYPVAFVEGVWAYDRGRWSRDSEFVPETPSEVTVTLELSAEPVVPIPSHSISFRVLTVSGEKWREEDLAYLPWVAVRTDVPLSEEERAALYRQYANADGALLIEECANLSTYVALSPTSAETDADGVARAALVAHSNADWFVTSATFDCIDMSVYKSTVPTEQSANRSVGLAAVLPQRYGDLPVTLGVSAAALQGASSQGAPAHPNLGLQAEVADIDLRGDLDELLDAFVMRYQAHATTYIRLFSYVGTFRTDVEAAGEHSEVRWVKDNIGKERCEIHIKSGVHPWGEAEHLLNLLRDVLSTYTARERIAENTPREEVDLVELQNLCLQHSVRTAALFVKTAARNSAELGSFFPGPIGMALTLAVLEADIVDLFWEDAAEPEPVLPMSVVTLPLRGGLPTENEPSHVTAPRLPLLEAGVVGPAARASLGPFIKLTRGLCAKTGRRCLVITIEIKKGHSKAPLPNGLRKACADAHAHHWWFRCLGGDAIEKEANLIKVASMLHTGRGIGLHQHILRELYAKKIIARPSYKALTSKWQSIRLAPDEAPRIMETTRFRDGIRSAYQSFFRGSPSEKAIMAQLDEALARVPIN